MLELEALWEQTFELWLRSRGSEHTRRSYRTAWEQFGAFCEKQPWKVKRVDAAQWADSLRSEGLAAETVHQRLAALSSFYAYAGRTLADEGITVSNPVEAVARPKRSPYGKSRYLTVEEARALLRAIPQYTLQGKRDYALFLAYLATGRRNGEIRKLRWGDFEVDGSRVWYRWQGKGKSRRDECPGVVWQAIRAFLKEAGRAESVQKEDYIFTPLCDNAVRLGNVSKRSWRRNRPLSANMVGKLLKKYCRRAGLDGSRVKVHTLRHTAAMLRKQAGDDLEGISAFLGHSSYAVTQVYLQRLEGQEDQTWAKVQELLGLSVAD